MGVYVMLWAATLLFAAIEASSGGWLAGIFGARERFWLSPASSPRPNVLLVVLLVTINLTRSAWPLALGAIGAHERRLARPLGDVLVAGFLARNALWVGSALGAYGLRLWAYTPQLPLEWAALALGAASWMVQRSRPVSSRERIVCAAVIAFVVVCAAVIEAYGVPHQ